MKIALSTVALLLGLCGLTQCQTEVHAPGVCAMYGNCGKKSIFGGELPCVANVEAVAPDGDTRAALEEVCGDRYWADLESICCDAAQIENLKKNLKKAENIIASCPACLENFKQFFCRFTCSPDQSTFVNITRTQQSLSGETIVAQLDQFVDAEFASDFYDSCKEVKFSATNGYAMDFIGGGAKDYKAFLKFLGDEKPMLGGSPFQIDFPWENRPDSMKNNTGEAEHCYDGEYKCSCADCSGSCPTLPALHNESFCTRFGWNSCYYAVSSLSIIVFIFIVIALYPLRLYLATALSKLSIKKRWKSWRSKRTETTTPLLADDDIDAPDQDDDGSFWDNESYQLVEKTYFINSWLQKVFLRWGRICATFPATVIGISLIIVALLTTGLRLLELETDPVKLWVSSDSREFKEKQHFDANFGPFYRIEQAFLVNETGPVLSEFETVQWWFEVEKNISSLHSESGVALEEICVDFDGACIVQSFSQYFAGDINRLTESTYKTQIQNCAKSPVECLPPFQQPLKPNVLFGDLKEGSSNVLDSSALVVTWVVGNSQDDNSEAIDWEQSLEQLFINDLKQQAADRGLSLSFSTEMSLEKELNKSSNTDIKIVVVSYLCMFIYASMALGGVIPGIGVYSFVQTKFSLGLFGIAVVLMSVSASVGILAYFGLKATLIIAEVIPFLVLAVGVDNIFLLTHELQNVNGLFCNDPLEERVARAVGYMGPSILLSSICEINAFLLASRVAMPAVKNFALYSAGAVFINTVLQLSLFVAALALDQRRTEDHRIDCFPCIRVSPDKDITDSLFTDQGRAISMASPGVFEEVKEPAFSKLIRRHYAPNLLKPSVKKIVLSLFTIWTAISIVLLGKFELGLDQSIALPDDSYLVPYFSDLFEHLSTGPPVYFVVKDGNTTEEHGQQALCGRFPSCDEFSLVSIIEQERKRSSESYIIDPAASWIDDFLMWMNPTLDECCRVKKTALDEFCSPSASPRQCTTCFAEDEYNTFDPPQGAEFLRYFKNWIEAPSDPCPLGGKAPYGAAVVPDYENLTIKTSSFRSTHTPLKSQNDFINAYASARRISDFISEKTDQNVYPYSTFYIFFAQYSTIVHQTAYLAFMAILSSMEIAVMILGSIRTAMVLFLVISMIFLNICGIMAVWGVSLNAVSLVNLIVCVGLAVEFCAHIVRGFTFGASGTLASKNARAINSLVNVGGSVLGGIALTKFIGVFVLAFTSSKIFEIYYFRMWFALVVVATLHALVFLPVALSIAGGHGYVLDRDDGGLAADLASRQEDE